jgi:hypothetical protein
MALFSRRNNLVPEPTPDKPGQISDRLRTLLWNDFDNACRNFYRDEGYLGLTVSRELSRFLEYIWSEHWGRPADDCPDLQQMMTHL